MWEVVQEGFTMPKNQATHFAIEKKLKEDWQKHYSALCFLQQVITKAIFSRIRGYRQQVKGSMG